MVPFLVPGSASSGAVVFRVPTRTEQYARWVRPFGGFVVSVRTTIMTARRATKSTTMATEQRDTMTTTMATDVDVDDDDDYDDDNLSSTTSDEGDNHRGRH